MIRQASALVLTLSVLVVAGCGGLVAADPGDPPARETIPRVVEVDPELRALVKRPLPQLARDSAERKAREGTVRVRNTTCEGVARGSGFALDRTTLITNRHVLAGASLLEVSTWDGRTIPVSSASVSVLGDLGIARVTGVLPTRFDIGGVVHQGESVVAVGYPLGGELRLLPGVVVDLVPGAPFGIPGRVIRLTAAVQPGNSGGPVLNSEGKVVGVVFAIEIKTQLALAIPASALRGILGGAGLQEVPPCGSE